MATTEDIYVVTAPGSGHIYPCIELCKLLISTNYKPTLVIPSAAALSDLHVHPLLSVFELSVPPGQPGFAQHQTGSDLETHLTNRVNGINTDNPVFAVIDFPMGWTKHIFWKFNIQVISLFTFGACAAAMEWGAWKSNCKADNPGEVHTIPGLPKEMNITYSDIKRQTSRASAGSRRGPPKAGDQPPWVPLIEGSIGLMLNTCHHLEHPFLDYIQNQMEMPVWSVGPLLPEDLLVPVDLRLPDHTQIRQKNPDLVLTNNYSEDDVIQWLNQKPKKSVLYVCFGSQVSPPIEELNLLADALEETKIPFIWVIQTSSNLNSKVFDNLEFRFENKGLVIKGWAPQLLILSHSSTCAFLSHCGWNSTMEAIAFQKPILAWPIRGDQFYNSKLVVNHLRIGFLAIGDNDSCVVARDDILKGMVKIMSDEQVQENVSDLRSGLCWSFQSGLECALDSFIRFMKSKK